MRNPYATIPVFYCTLDNVATQYTGFKFEQNEPNAPKTVWEYKNQRCFCCSGDIVDNFQQVNHCQDIDNFSRGQILKSSIPLIQIKNKKKKRKN